MPAYVTHYDIWPGNTASLFLQPRRLHSADLMKIRVHTWLTTVLLLSSGYFTSSTEKSLLLLDMLVISESLSAVDNVGRHFLYTAGT